MPCGGIYPITWVPDEMVEEKSSSSCFHCGGVGPGPWSFVEEWDANIHDKCIDEFLQTEEGKCVLSHGHEVVRREKQGE